MSFFGGFSDTFSKQLASSRAEEADRAERQAAMESQILQHLSTSDDPEIASHAITGLLDLAGPQRRAKGLGGWLGKVAAHPAMPTIRQLISQGRQVETKAPEAPRMNVEEGLRSLPGVPVDGGDPGAATAGGRVMGPPSPDEPEIPSAAVPPPMPAFASGYQPAQTTTVPRQLFDTPAVKAAKTARATTAGTLQGKVDVMRGTGGAAGQGPLTEEEQELLFPGRALMSSGTVQGKAAPPGSLDHAGRPLNPEGYYTTKVDPRDPSKAVYIPTTTPSSVTNQAAIASRPTFQMYAGPDGKTPARWRVYRDGSKPAEFLGYIPQRGSYLPYVDPETGETTYQTAPAPMTPVPAAPAGGAPPAPHVSGVTPVAQAALTAAAQTPPRAAAGSQATAAAPPPVAGPKGISGGRKRTLTQTEGAFLNPTTGEPQVGRALYDPVTGKYYSAQDPNQEATGFIPGPEGAYATTAYAQANNTLITIAAAKKAIEDAGLLTNNDPAATAKLMAKFYGGTVGENPIEAAVSSLTNLAGIQGATQYVKSNSRSYQMFQAALQHLPNVPTQRVAAMTQLPIVGKAVTPTTAMLAGGHGWDSFASMYRKLEQAETIIKSGKVSLAELTGKTADRAVGASDGPPAPGAARPSAGPAAPTARSAAAPAVPPAVKAALQGQGPGRHTLSDGSVWVIDATGQIRPGG